MYPSLKFTLKIRIRVSFTQSHEHSTRTYTFHTKRSIRITKRDASKNIRKTVVVTELPFTYRKSLLSPFLRLGRWIVGHVPCRAVCPSTNEQLPSSEIPDKKSRCTMTSEHAVVRDPARVNGINEDFARSLWRLTAHKQLFLMAAEARSVAPRDLLTRAPLKRGREIPISCVRIPWTVC